ncbi:MAG: hypothetical protein WC595_05805 [Candidatus Nanoarchaeia archaeon]
MSVNLVSKWMMEVILFCVLVVLFFAAIPLIQNDDTHIQQKEVRELALTHDALLAAPNSAKVAYNLPSEFIVEQGEDCLLTVRKTSVNGPNQPARWKCVDTKKEEVIFGKGEGGLEVGTG